MYRGSSRKGGRALISFSLLPDGLMRFATTELMFLLSVKLTEFSAKCIENDLKSLNVPPKFRANSRQNFDANSLGSQRKDVPPQQ